MQEAPFAMKKPNIAKLREFGFAENGGTYAYGARIAEGQLQMTVTVTGGGDIRARVIDPATGEEYVLHRTSGAAGAFVGMVRTEYEALLTEIAERCFDPDVFKSACAREVISYVRAAYGGELEFLWKRFPGNAVWRREDTRKWYGALLTVPERKLGLASGETAEIIDLRADPEELAALVDGERYFPGYHMNKKHWLTIRLNGMVPAEEIFRRIDESYRLAAK